MDKQKTQQIREEFKQLESPNARLIDKQMEISSQISRYLQQQGLTQKELAQKADMGESQLSEIMRGEGNPTLKTLVKLEEALGQDIIVAPSFHEEQMTRKGFASVLPKDRAFIQSKEREETVVVRVGNKWELKRELTKAYSEEVEYVPGEFSEEDNNVTALVS
ncbi:helix-turn-helix domain-containing protein [Fodinibius sediminis]|uniref:Helix-turn-helix n=1 Tax=Fodinibius sediminis TaxID=1214077 RepID=A0A521FGY2_9BACT|nr:helix-turn-helix transcriptional regulator [Fodinibius sediminis]SMO95426.1 Helix-turn-helix [Fodinibius sediminis]